jgi:hypothetical protein
MKFKKINIIIALVFCCTIWSCKKELNVYPTTSEVDGNVIIDTKSAADVLNGVYYRFANVGPDYNNVPSVQWTIVNEEIPSELSGMLTSLYPDDFINYNFNSQTSEVGVLWNYNYSLINAANEFLKNISPVSNIPTATKTEMVAEAKFLRAFGNSELLLYFGQYNDPSSKFGIILRDTFVNSSNLNLPRSTVSATYNSIFNDLNTAISGLPSQNTSLAYANSWCAKLLEAQILLNRGASGDYSKAIALTNDIIINGPFQLENSLQNLFWTAGYSSKEVMMSLPPLPNETYKYTINQIYIEYAPTDTLISLLNNDPRNQWIYKNINSPYYGTISEFTKYYSGDPVNVMQTPLSETSYAFRLTEAYLVEAEAICLSGQDIAPAKVLLKTVEGKSGITDFSTIDAATTPSQLQFLIVKENLKNFVGENGQDYFALRRLPFATLKTIQPLIKSSSQLILPIPFSETSANSQVVQNPGYSN